MRVKATTYLDHAWSRGHAFIGLVNFASGENEGDMRMDTQIRCKVFPGQFSNEYAIKASDANNVPFSLFAPITAVETDETPTRDKAVEGWLKVAIWERAGENVIIQLPRESFESGRFVTVNVTQFKSRPELVRS